jgi:hypothetical protein
MTTAYLTSDVTTDGTLTIAWRTGEAHLGEEWGPVYEGNGAASGKPKYTSTAIVTKRTKDETYNDVTTGSVELELQAAWTAATY